MHPLLGLLVPEIHNRTQPPIYLHALIPDTPPKAKSSSVTIYNLPTIHRTCSPLQQAWKRPTGSRTCQDNSYQWSGGLPWSFCLTVSLDSFSSELPCLFIYITFPFFYEFIYIYRERENTNTKDTNTNIVQTQISIGSKTIDFPLRFLPPIPITTNLHSWNQYSNFKNETKLKNVAKVTNY